MRILLDVNMSPLWLEYLRAAGHHAVLWTAIGAPRAPDSEIVRYAREQGFVIFSRDLDFGAILAASGAKLPSVIQLRGSGQFPKKIGPRVLRILERAAPDLEAGAFVSMDLSKTRLRSLPLKPQ